MSIDNFIPEIWSARLLENLTKTLVYGQPTVVNTDYEGEISGLGSVVKINSIGEITVGDYVKNQVIGEPQVLDGTQLTLVIDQSKYFNFLVDDIDKAQQKPKVMDAAMRDAAYRLAEHADRYIAGLYVGAPAANLIGSDTTPIAPTAETAYEYLVDLGTVLDENNVPRTSRWVVVPPWFYGLLLKDDRFVGNGSDMAGQVLRNGEVGQAAGFTVLVSNNVPNTAGAQYKIMAGSNIAISYAEQINTVEAYRPEKRFADAVKGLHLYGAKLIRPEAIAVLTANRA